MRYVLLMGSRRIHLSDIEVLKLLPHLVINELVSVLHPASIRYFARCVFYA